MDGCTDRSPCRHVASTSAPLEWSHDELVFSSLKVNPKTGDLMRWFNMAGTDTKLKLKSLPSRGVYKSSILEVEGTVQSFDNQESFTPVKPHEIVTLGVKVSVSKHF